MKKDDHDNYDDGVKTGAGGGQLYVTLLSLIILMDGSSCKLKMQQNNASKPFN